MMSEGLEKALSVTAPPKSQKSQLPDSVRERETGLINNNLSRTLKSMLCCSPINKFVQTDDKTKTKSQFTAMCDDQSIITNGASKQNAFEDHNAWCRPHARGYPNVSSPRLLDPERKI